MKNVNNEVVEFYKKLGYTLIEIKSSVFREEESTLVFQTDNKNHTVDGSTILYDHAIAIHHQLQKAREQKRTEISKYIIDHIKPGMNAKEVIGIIGDALIPDHSELDQDKV